MKEEITTTIKGRDICLNVANSLMWGGGGRFVICLLFLILSNVVEAQTITYFYGKDPIRSSDGKYTCALYSVELKGDNTLVKLEITALTKIKNFKLWYSENTYIVVNENYKIRINVYQLFSNIYYWTKDRLNSGEKCYITVKFQSRIPAGVTNFTLEDYGYNGTSGYKFRNYTINNPAIGKTSWTEESIKQHADEINDGICGIYECSDGNGYILGCVKEKGTYKLIFLRSARSNVLTWWKTGDLKAILRPTATYGLCKADWYMANKTIRIGEIVFDGVRMKTNIDEKDEYLKIYPNFASGGSRRY